MVVLQTARGGFLIHYEGKYPGFNLHSRDTIDSMSTHNSKNNQTQEVSSCYEPSKCIQKKSKCIKRMMMKENT